MSLKSTIIYEYGEWIGACVCVMLLPERQPGRVLKPRRVSLQSLCASLAMVMFESSTSYPAAEEGRRAGGGRVWRCS